MGRRSINTTKSGKYMNPTDQARKEARRKELKKNRKQRTIVRAAVLKSKDPVEILEEMEMIDKMEFDPLNPPKLNERVLKEKRRKLKETLDRVLKMYDKEDPGSALELKRLIREYENRQSDRLAYFHQVKNAERVKVEQIPLPDLVVYPTADTALIPMPIDIYAPSIPMPTLTPPAHGILKKPVKRTPLHVLLRTRKVPGPPPGAPPMLSGSSESGSSSESEGSSSSEESGSDETSSESGKERGDGGDEEYDPGRDIHENIGAHMEADTEMTSSAERRKKDKKTRKSEAAGRENRRTIRFADDKEDEGRKSKRRDSKGHKKSVRIAGHEGDSESEGSSSGSDRGEGKHTKRHRERPDSPSSSSSGSSSESEAEDDAQGAGKGPQRIIVPPGPPAGLPPGATGPRLAIPPPAPPGMPPGMYRPMPGPGGRMLPPRPGMMMPRGMLPPGMPRGGMQMMPPGAPGRFRMPPMNVMPPMGIPLPPGPGPAGSMLAAPPNIHRQAQPGTFGAAAAPAEKGPVITAKPQIKNLVGDATKLVPTAVKFRREFKDHKGRLVKPKQVTEESKREPSAVKQPANVPTQTTDDAYAQFMSEMDGLL